MLVHDNGPLDRNSIMIYPSFSGSEIEDPTSPAGRPTHWLRSPDPAAPNGLRDETLWMGGTREFFHSCCSRLHLVASQGVCISDTRTADPSRVRPSAIDIQRVLALYPLPPGGWPPNPAQAPAQRPRRRMQRRAGEVQHKVKVVIGGFTTTVLPVPEHTPLYVGTKELGEEVEKWVDGEGRFVFGLGDCTCVLKKEGGCV